MTTNGAKRDVGRALRAVRDVAACLALAAAALFSGPASSQPGDAGFVYTEIYSDDCLLFDRDHVYAAVACPAPGDLTFILAEGDLRMFLGFVHPDWDETVRIRAPRARFNWLPGPVVEWLLDAQGRPTALIARLQHATDDEGGTADALLVFRIDMADPSRVCLVADIPQRPGANADARSVAEAAASASCLS